MTELTAREDFRSRTQMKLQDIDSNALDARRQGMSFLNHTLINFNVAGNRLYCRQLIASMNYSVSQAKKELDRRNKAGNTVFRKPSKKHSKAA